MLPLLLVGGVVGLAIGASEAYFKNKEADDLGTEGDIPIPTKYKLKISAVMSLIIANYLATALVLIWLIVINQKMTQDMNEEEEV